MKIKDHKLKNYNYSKIKMKEMTNASFFCHKNKVEIG